MDDVASAYDRWSASYDRQPNETRDLDELVLRRVLPDLAGLAVVECGCGTGKNSEWLAPRCARLIGLDFSAGMLAHARSKVAASNALFVRHDLREPWPISSGSADAVLFNLVLEHVESLGPVFLEAGRVLRSGGLLLVSEYHPGRVTAGKGPVVMAADGTVLHRIPNFLHTLDAYTEGAGAAGLVTLSVAEWREADLRPEAENGREKRDSLPQLISLVFRKP